jgi:predicted ATPase
VAARAGKGQAAPEAERAFFRACELCEELGDPARLAYALRGLFGSYYVAGRWRDAARVAGRIGAAAERLNDRAALCASLYVEGAARLYRGEPTEAVRRLRDGLRRYDEADRGAYVRQSGIDMATSIRSHLAVAEWLTGLPGQAASTSREDLDAARRLGHPLSLAQALTNGALLRLLVREWDAAEGLAAETREVCARFGLAAFASFGTMIAGMAAAARDSDTGAGTGLIREGMAALRRVGGQFLVPLALAHLGLALGTSGDHEAALDAAAGALRMARANHELAWEAEALRVLGEVRHAAGAEAGEVEADLLAAVEVARRQGARSFELRAAISVARIWRGGGRLGEARDLLAPVYGWFTEGFDTPDLVEARALLDELASAPRAAGETARPRVS